jgi:hypothetical protein
MMTDRKLEGRITREAKYYVNGCFISFVNTYDAGPLPIQFWMGPVNDEQMETAISLSPDEAIEILEAAIKIVKGL